jgi:hypothetical protein
MGSGTRRSKQVTNAFLVGIGNVRKSLTSIGVACLARNPHRNGLSTLDEDATRNVLNSEACLIAALSSRLQGKATRSLALTGYREVFVTTIGIRLRNQSCVLVGQDQAAAQRSRPFARLNGRISDERFELSQTRR